MCLPPNQRLTIGNGTAPSSELRNTPSKNVPSLDTLNPGPVEGRWPCIHLDADPRLLQNCERMDSVVLSYPVCGDLSHCSRKTNMPGLSVRIRMQKEDGGLAWQWDSAWDTHLPHLSAGVKSWLHFYFWLLASVHFRRPQVVAQVSGFLS